MQDACIYRLYHTKSYYYFYLKSGIFFTDIQFRKTWKFINSHTYIRVHSQTHRATPHSLTTTTHSRTLPDTNTNTYVIYKVEI